MRNLLYATKRPPVSLFLIHSANGHRDKAVPRNDCREGVIFHISAGITASSPVKENYKGAHPLTAVL